MAHIDIPRDSAGWSIYTPSSDSIIVYVSEEGNDSTGLPYAYDDFADPLEPVGEMAFATYLGAFNATRDDKPDWILFKRGDAFYEHIVLRDIHPGRSEAEPFLVSSYGASGALPVWKIGANDGIDMRNGLTNVIYSNIEFYSHTADPDSPEFVDYGGGKAVYGTVSDGEVIVGLMFEGCKFRFCKSILIQKYNSLACGHITIRRCLFEKNYSHTSHASGIFMSAVDNLILTENIFYHCGWLIQNKTGNQGDPSEGQATFFSHSFYAGMMTNLLIENNLFLESAGAGVKLTAEGIASCHDVAINNNLFFGAIIGVAAGNNYDEYSGRFKDIEMKYNVFANIGWSRPTLQETSWYTYNDGWEDGEFSHNLLINQHNPINNNVKGLFFEANLINVSISDNTVYGLDTGHGISIEPDGSGNPIRVSNTSIDDNIIHMPHGYSGTARALYDITGIISFSGNRYYNEDNTEEFNYLGSGVDFAGWVAATGDTSTIERVVFFDETRDIASYNESVGGTATIEAFFDECVLQDRYNWNPDYEASAVNDYLRAGFTEVFMTTTYHAPNTWNNSNNKYKYPEVQAVIDADALQNMAGDGSVMFDGSGNAIAKSQVELVALPEMNNNKQVYGCFEEGGTGMAQYSVKNTDSNDAEVKDYFLSCLGVTYNRVQVTHNGENVTHA